MLKSMTGFGKASKVFEKFDILVEIKSVNSKYFDPSFRMPRVVSSMEIEMRSAIQEKLLRGKVDIRIEITSKTAISKPVLNVELFNRYKSIINQIKDGALIEEQPKIEHFLRLPDIIEFQPDETTEGELEKNVMETLRESMEAIDRMRLEEGGALEADCIKRLRNLQNIVEVVDEAKNGVFEYWLEKFKKRMKDMEVLPGFEERIIQEASVYGEKADITEEITRLRSHIAQFLKILETEHPAGKKLDFLSQEIHREFNTIASKSSKSQIIAVVVEAKAETDRIREQVQNIV